MQSGVSHVVGAIGGIVLPFLLGLGISFIKVDEAPANAALLFHLALMAIGLVIFILPWVLRLDAPLREVFWAGGAAWLAFDTLGMSSPAAWIYFVGPVAAAALLYVPVDQPTRLLSGAFFVFSGMLLFTEGPLNDADLGQTLFFAVGAVYLVFLWFRLAPEGKARSTVAYLTVVLALAGAALGIWSFTDTERWQSIVAAVVAAVYAGLFFALHRGKFGTFEPAPAEA